MISKTRLGGLDLWIPSKYKKLGSKAEVGFMTSVPLHLRFFRDIGVGGVDSLPFLLSRAPGSWSPVQWMGSVLLSAFVPPTCVVWAQDITKAWGRTTSQRSWSQLALTIYIGDIKFSHIWSRKDELLGSGIACWDIRVSARYFRYISFNSLSFIYYVRYLRYYIITFIYSHGYFSYKSQLYIQVETWVQ